MACGDQVAMPAQHGLGTHQQPDLPEHLAGEWPQQDGEQRAISWSEPDLLAVQLPLEDRELVPECQDFGVLVPVAHGK